MVLHALCLTQAVQGGILKTEKIARETGFSPSAIANKLRLCRLSPAEQQEILCAGLTERHARALLRLDNMEQKMTMIAAIVSQGMSVARTEEAVARLLEDRKTEPGRPNVGAFLNHLTQSLARIQMGGIPAVSERRETEDRIVLTITIPK